MDSDDTKSFTKERTKYLKVTKLNKWLYLYLKIIFLLPSIPTEIRKEGYLFSRETDLPNLEYST